MRTTNKPNNAKKRRIVRLAIVCIVILAAPSMLVNAQASNTPESRAKDFYSWYLKAIVKHKDPIKNKTVLSSHLSVRFSRWLYSKAGQSGAADAFLSSGEWKDAWADNIEVGEAVFPTENNAVMHVTLSAPPDEFLMKLQVFLVKERGKWKIDRVTGLFD